MAEELTTVQISKEASAMLDELKQTYKRSKGKHVEWLIEQDYRKLAAVKLVGEVKVEMLTDGKNPNGEE